MLETAIASVLLYLANVKLQQKDAMVLGGSIGLLWF